MKQVCATLAALVAFSVAGSELRAAAGAEDFEGLFGRLDANGDALVEAAEVPAEHQRLFARLVRLADSDSDGRLTPEEFAAGLRPSTPPKPIAAADLPDAARRTKPLRLLLLKLDTDRDAFLTRDEAPTELSQAFEQLAAACDNDKNGEIAFRELVQNNQQAVRAAQRVARQQRWNVDAELRKVERAQGGAAARFDRPPSPRAVLGNEKRLDSLFKTLDNDSDGALTLAELPEEARGPLDRLLTRADRDNDGRITRQEFRNAGEQLSRAMSLVDRPDGANKPTPGGAKEGAKDARNQPADGSERIVQQMLRRLDRNGDQQISRDEARGPLARRFDRADSNGDGRIDQRELAAVARIVQSRFDQPGRRAN
ncbi:MAG: hypothetical protein KDA37_13095 [Planctomycetales bacterium]|nr:hypothetical protein [Planctomycetales bacterium]